MVTPTLTLTHNSYFAFMSSNNSFQILLEAEQQASALVNEARQCTKKEDYVCFNNRNYIYQDRAQRLKDARREALEEIEELKRKKNEELIEHEKRVKKNGMSLLLLILSLSHTHSLYLACG